VAAENLPVIDVTAIGKTAPIPQAELGRQRCDVVHRASRAPPSGLVDIAGSPRVVPGMRHVASPGEAGHMPRCIRQRIDEPDELVGEVRGHRDRTGLGFNRYEIEAGYSHLAMKTAMVTAKMVVTMGHQMMTEVAMVLMAGLRGAGKKA
jgi:hypothetical protein